MARKKHHKRKHHRHHRVSGIGSIGGIDFSSIIGAAVGGLGGAFANKVIPASVNPKLSAAIKIIAGAMVHKSVKNSVGSGVGLGLIAIGSVELLQQMGFLSGIGAPQDTDMMAVSLEGADDEHFGETVLGETVLGETEIQGEGDLNTINGEQEFVISGDLDTINGAYVEEI